ncbi:hypothetical protein [Coraliomargarita akajimensis]|uniref:PEP-CTERM protein-sorting domain-containing protein n=1 Tax=Coraliomargarita akajimensis (strain DSM 45221 / IAM 15411 / JCM 23193 / KCTC 12865 / 04OKA010-24) TaxID=583355 RepID=D5EKY2_CORAD|nr:hypothetical protein [Coraliomargarita akajimensis]ADE53084.1 hypothetical protein Caka_0055 [Coraliomargarita akajimensis DSM 45221]
MDATKNSIDRLIQSERSGADLPQGWISTTTIAGAAIAVVPCLDASIAYSGPTNIVLDANSVTSQKNYSLNFDGDGFTDAELRQVEFGGGVSQFALAFIPNTTTRNNRVMVETAINWVQQLSSGALIGPAGNFDFGSNYLRVSFNGTLGYGNFTGRGFAGFQFEATGGTTHYAWADLEVAADGSSITVHGWAYETTANTAIQAGAVPEPAHAAGALGLLAMGAAGLRRFRGSRNR